MPDNSENVLLLIPKNIKLGLLPFVINPNVLTNNLHTGENQLHNPQLFSFKFGLVADDQRLKTDGYNLNSATIYTFPPSLRLVVLDDISYRLVNNPKFDSGQTNAELTYADLLSSLPTIQIREMLPDAKIEYIASLFEMFSMGFKSATDDKEPNDDKSLLTKAAETGKIMMFLARNVLAIIKPILDYIDDNNGIYKVDNIYSSITKTVPNDSYKSAYNYVLDFVHTLYYKLLTTTTTNIYEFPMKLELDMYKTHGSVGWLNREIGFGGMTGNSVLGSILKSQMKSIQIKGTPFWDPTDEEGVTITVKVDLFNTDIKSTINNFIMVNTLIPGSMSMLYGIYKHSPDLYDIKLDGVGRYFLCSGDFSVKGKGVLRSLSMNVLNELVKKHSSYGSIKPNETKSTQFDGLKAGTAKLINDLKIAEDKLRKARVATKDKVGDRILSSLGSLVGIDNDPTLEKDKKTNKSPQDEYNAAIKAIESEIVGNDVNEDKYTDVVKSIKKNNLIRIPDVYELTLTFKSLLPNNFNNYIFNYSHNRDQVTSFEKTLVTEGILDTVKNEILKKLGEFITDQSNRDNILNPENEEIGLRLDYDNQKSKFKLVVNQMDELKLEWIKNNSYDSNSQSTSNLA